MKEFKKLYGLDAVDVILKRYYSSLYAIAISYHYMEHMTSAGAINIMNRVASICDDYSYLMTYRDEETHDCVLVFQQETISK